jgi:hypothetical protein
MRCWLLRFPLLLAALAAGVVGDPHQRSGERARVHALLARQKAEAADLAVRHERELRAVAASSERPTCDRSGDGGSAADDAVPLSAAQLQQFVVHGFVRLRPSLPPSYHARVFNRTQRVLRDEFNPGNNVLPRLPLLARLLDDPVLRGALASVLGEGYLLHAHRYCHESHPADQAWHKDTYFDYFQPHHHAPRMAMVYYYPQRTPVALGPTRVAPGTQYYGGSGHAADWSAHSLAGDGEAGGGEAGQAVLVHYNLLHGGARNTLVDWAGREGMQHSGMHGGPPPIPREQQRLMFKFQFVRMAPPTPLAQLPRWLPTLAIGTDESGVPPPMPPAPLAFTLNPGAATPRLKALLAAVGALMHARATRTATQSLPTAARSGTPAEDAAAVAELERALERGDEIEVDGAQSPSPSLSPRRLPWGGATAGGAATLSPSELATVRHALGQGLGYYRSHYSARLRLWRELSPVWAAVWRWMRGGGVAVGEREGSSDHDAVVAVPWHAAAAAALPGWQLAQVEAWSVAFTGAPGRAALTTDKEAAALGAAYSLAAVVAAAASATVPQRGLDQPGRPAEAAALSQPPPSARAGALALQPLLRALNGTAALDDEPRAFMAQHALSAAGPAALAGLLQLLAGTRAEAAVRWRAALHAGGGEGGGEGPPLNCSAWALALGEERGWKALDSRLALVVSAVGGATRSRAAARRVLPVLAAVLAPPAAAAPPPVGGEVVQGCGSVQAWHSSVHLLPLSRRNAAEALGIVGAVLARPAAAPRAAAAAARACCRLSAAGLALAPLLEAAVAQGDVEADPHHGEGWYHTSFRTGEAACRTQRGYLAALALAQLGPCALVQPSGCGKVAREDDAAPAVGSGSGSGRLRFARAARALFAAVQQHEGDRYVRGFALEALRRAKASGVVAADSDAAAHGLSLREERWVSDLLVRVLMVARHDAQTNQHSAF